MIIAKLLIEELQPVSPVALDLLNYSDVFYFLGSKLMNDQEIMDQQYIYKNSILPLKHHIHRVNKVVLKFVNNKNSHIAFDIKYYKNYTQNDLIAMSIAIHKLYAAATHSLIAFNELDKLLKLSIFRNLDFYSSFIYQLTENTELISPIKFIH